MVHVDHIPRYRKKLADLGLVHTYIIDMNPLIIFVGVGGPKAGETPALHGQRFTARRFVSGTSWKSTVPSVRVAT